MEQQSTETLFLLTARAFDSQGQCHLCYWGISENGPVRIDITPHQPVFFVPRRAAIPEDLPHQRRPLNLKTFRGEEADGLYFPTLAAARDMRTRVMDSGFPVCEGDVRPEDRWLMERFITGSCEIEGPYRREGNFRVFQNPLVRPSEKRVGLNVLSLDIETGKNGQLYSFALDLSGRSCKRFVGVLSGEQKTGEARPLSLENLDAESLVEAQWQVFDGERTLLRHLISKVQEWDPDLVIGWHVIGFDLDFLERKAQELGIPLILGRSKRPLRLSRKSGLKPLADVDGRIVIDGPPALRGAFHRFSDWTLDTVAQELLGQGKDIHAHGEEKIAEIERRFAQDQMALAQYNLLDSILVTRIFETTGILDQLVTRSLITGLPPDQVHRSVASFDRFFLPRLHRKGYVAPDSRNSGVFQSTPGAMVFSDGYGLFEDVAVLDFKSLYPSLIQTFHIDPYALIMSPSNPMGNPGGEAVFSRSEHILPAYIGELMARRATAKAAGDGALAQAVKILMNSMYGVMGATGCRFARPELAASITGIGRWVLRSTRERLGLWGYDVLYGDTDSVFVRLKTQERQDARSAASKLASRVDAYFRHYFKKEYDVESHLELEFEKLYVRLFIPAMRGMAGEGAVKRYAGYRDDGSIEIKGMESVRSDATPLAQEFQRELFQRYFQGEDIRPWIKDTVARLREGEMDHKLVYKRRLARAIDAYASPPPHVRAAQLLDPDGTRGVRHVSYVMTPHGPIPMELSPKNIDYEHYIEKQLRPVADDVLSYLGDSFDSVVRGRQLDLFG
ncbi:MAG: DNA polymerase II [Spirochaetales bacterium]|nr:DNA polymerase II [Spirochaetales bacterium]